MHVSAWMQSDLLITYCPKEHLPESNTLQSLTLKQLEIPQGQIFPELNQSIRILTKQV